MSKDRLYLIEPGFEDPARPGSRFYCPYCNAIEGLIATHPGLAGRIDVTRVPFARPRRQVIELIGEANQGLPVLILGDALPLPLDIETYGSVHFVSATKRILELLNERHGFPVSH